MFNNNNQPTQPNTQTNIQPNTQTNSLNTTHAQMPSTNTNTSLPSFGGGLKFNTPTTQTDQNKPNPMIFNNNTQPKPTEQQQPLQPQTQTQPNQGGLLFNKNSNTEAPQGSVTATQPLSTTTGGSSTPLFNKS